MTTIRLKQYGHFLSGRSLPQKILSEVMIDNVIKLDFSGVSACNQSFVNELFQCIEARGIKLSTVEIIGLDTSNLQNIVGVERARFIQITA